MSLIFAIYSFTWVPTWAWWVLAWLAVSVVTSLGIGRAIRDRDAHAPTMTVARHLAVVRDEERSAS